MALILRHLLIVVWSSNGVMQGPGRKRLSDPIGWWLLSSTSNICILGGAGGLNTMTSAEAVLLPSEITRVSERQDTTEEKWFWPKHAWSFISVIYFMRWLFS